MYDYFELNAIPILLDKFKVNKLVLTGSNNIEIVNLILKYCIDYNASYVEFELKKDSCEDSPLKILPNLKNYDAIFVDDDPNWYTVYNELKIIKENNRAFPLVFICHNIFPNRRRDSYFNPNFIPESFRKNYSDKLEYEDIIINDNFYHATDEKTPHNGVLTAIEDFLVDNDSIGIINFKIENGITILYYKNKINQFRLEKLAEEINKYRLNNDDNTEEMIENQHFNKYIKNHQDNDDIVNKFQNEINTKNKIIEDYKEKIKLNNAELNYKDSQLSVIKSKLLLKDSQIKNFESKLINRENEIESKNNEIKSKNNEIKSKNNEIKSKNNEIKSKNEEIKSKNEEIKSKNNEINSIKQKYTHQSSKLDTKEYCIECYKKEINNTNQEIQYLKKDIITKKLLSPIAYLYLFFKSKPRELSLNFKLYRALKDSKCFDIGYYLNNNKDLLNSKWCKYFSLELHYVCNGFKENRDFNKKYFNRNSKKELLNYILNCNP